MKMQNQIIESAQDRLLNGVVIRQRTKDSFFNLKDVLASVNKWILDNGGRDVIRAERYFALKSTKELLAELKTQKGINGYVRARGKSESWIHPFIMIDLLLWCNPQFKIVAYDWIMDYLIQNRLSSADSYTRMCGALYLYSTNRSEFAKNIQNLARLLREQIGVTDWNHASAKQLELRDYAHNIIADLAKTFKDSTKGATLGMSILIDKLNKDSQCN